MEKTQNIKVLVNNMILIFLLSTFNLGCQQITQNEESCKQQNKREIIPDTSINNILMLRDYSSFEIFYPNFNKISLVETIRDGSPIAIFSNIDFTEYLLAYKHEGDVKNSYSCFEIGYWNDEKFDTLKNYITNEKEFITDSGIKLGISLDSIVKIKGSDYKIQKNGTDTFFLIYEITDYKHSDFLKRYDMPSYFMKYTIRNNVVQQIMFGFDYP